MKLFLSFFICQWANIGGVKMFLLVFLSKSKIFTRVTLVLHWCPRVSLLSLASGTRFEFRLTFENEFFIFRKYYRKIVLLVTKMRLLPSFNQNNIVALSYSTSSHYFYHKQSLLSVKRNFNFLLNKICIE